MPAHRRQVCEMAGTLAWLHAADCRRMDRQLPSKPTGTPASEWTQWRWPAGCSPSTSTVSGTSSTTRSSATPTCSAPRASLRCAGSRRRVGPRCPTAAPSLNKAPLAVTGHRRARRDQPRRARQHALDALGCEMQGAIPTGPSARADQRERRPRPGAPIASASVVGQTRPRQAPVSAPRDSTNSLKRSRSPSTRRPTTPKASPTASFAPVVS